jgi:hypothetical protein
MAKKEGILDNNDLFNLIEIPDPIIKEKEDDKTKEITVKPKVNEDGSFEIDSFGFNDIKTEKEDKIEPVVTEKEQIEVDTDSPYLAFAQYNAKEGIFEEFTEDEWKTLVEEKGEEGALYELNKRTIDTIVEKRLEEYKGTLTEEDKMLFEAKINGYPVDEYAVVKNNIQYLSTLTEDDLADEKLQEELTRQKLLVQGMTEDEVEDTISAYKDTNKLSEKSKGSLTFLKGFYEREDKRIKQEKIESDNRDKQNRDEQLKTLKQQVETFTEIVPGLKINKPTKEKIVESITNPAGYDKDGKAVNVVQMMQQRNPYAHLAILHYYHMLGLFNIDKDGNFKPDFSKLNEKFTTEATNKLKKAFESNTRFTGGYSGVGKTVNEKQIDSDMSKSLANIDKFFKKRS